MTWAVSSFSASLCFCSSACERRSDGEQIPDVRLDGAARGARGVRDSAASAAGWSNASGPGAFRGSGIPGIGDQSRSDRARRSRVRRAHLARIPAARQPSGLAHRGLLRKRASGRP